VSKFLGLVALVVIALLSLAPAPEQKVVFLDVGQGDSILLQDRTRQVLIDGGPGAKVLRRLGEEMPLFDEKIEVMILTHPQRDHMEGLMHVLERYEVGMVLLPWAANTSQMQAAWLDMILERGIPHRFAKNGQSLEVGDMKFKILGPFDTPEAQAAIKSDVNNASVVTRVDYRDMSFLLTGDAEKRVESMMVDNLDGVALDVDVLKAGHHGSNSSTHESLINAASPSAAVISVGADNKFGHPRPEVLDRLGDIPVWRTDELGSVRFEYESGRWLTTGLRVAELGGGH